MNYHYIGRFERSKMQTRLFHTGLVALGVLATLGMATPATHAATYTYVGSWDLSNLDGNYDNPSNPYVWTNNPQCYSGVQAAAVLFGGSASDYVISTVDSNPADINGLTFLDGWGDDQYLFNPQSDTFSLQTGSGYNDPGGSGTSYSALVTDHAPFDGGPFINYAFRVTSVPEPSSVAAFALGGLVLAGVILRRRSTRA
jgi:hypothetical protein